MFQTVSADTKARDARRSAGPAASVAPIQMFPIASPGNQAMLRLQRKCDCGGGPHCDCDSKDEKKHKSALHRAAASPDAPREAPPIVHDVLRSPGETLDPATRAFFESRFRHDFSGVRIHADSRAAESARAVNAHAYTVGRDIAFAPGRFAPATAEGRGLLAHELAHVVQTYKGVQAEREISEPSDPSEHEAVATAQAVMNGGPVVPRANASPAARLQRACGPKLGAPSPDCSLSDAGLVGQQFSFIVNCNDLKPGEEANLTTFAKGLPPGAELKVHGYASVDGPADFNLSLSCHRANVIADKLRAARPDCNVSAIFKHGAQSGAPGGDFWRMAIVETVKAKPQPAPLCPSVPTTTPSTCAGRHDGYAAAARCFPLNGWLPCAARASAQVCEAIDAFSFNGTDGTLLEGCVLANRGDRGLTKAKGAWFNNTNACIWGHWRAALEAMHDPSRPIPSGLTPEWANAVNTCRNEGIGSTTCCEAHVEAEQFAIDRCGGYDDTVFGPLPTDVPGAPVCSDLAFLKSGPLPFIKNFGKVADRIDYGELRCCTF
jgi:outer membrane protein OmpA-like peptidoglycan-associated protein